jgi:hypothetical protein
MIYTLKDFIQILAPLKTPTKHLVDDEDIDEIAKVLFECMENEVREERARCTRAVVRACPPNNLMDKIIMEINKDG